MNNSAISVKYFFLRITVFIFPILIMFIYLEVQLRTFPVDDLSEKRNLFEARLDSIELLILGSSHASNGINPQFFQLKSFNLAHNGQAVYYDTNICNKYLSNMPKLKVVVFPISYFSLFTQYKRNRKIEYYQSYKIPNDSIMNQFSTYSLLCFISPKVAVSKLLNNKFRSRFDLNGFDSLHHTKESTIINDSTGLERFKKFEEKVVDDLFLKSCQDVEILCKRLNDRNIQIVFITTPQFKTITQYFKLETLSQNQKFIQEMCVKYKCHYFNYQDDNRFLKQDFFNNDHLNPNGAEKFSKLLNADISLKLK
jgi:hypothetical protein